MRIIEVRMSEKAHITPSVLKWSRTTARYNLKRAAQATKYSVETIEAWEEGTEVPTVKQAEKLAHLYRRPFALLFLPSPPRDFTPLQDFRSKNRGEFSTALEFILREVQQKQAWARETFEENAETQVPFVGKFTRRSAPEVIAQDIRKTLGIVTSEYNGKGLKYWTKKTEESGIFVSLSSFYHTRMKLDSEEVKGFAIADPYAPFIFINSDDWDNSQLFTLVHELAHIWINQSGISVDIHGTLSPAGSTQIEPVETFCNQVASLALLPTVELERIVSSKQKLDYADVESISRQFNTSTLAVLYRLKNSNVISVKQFSAWKSESDHRFQLFLKREEEATRTSKGGPDYYVMQIRRNGQAFSHLVLDAYRGGQISGVEASNLLNIKINHFPAFENRLLK